MNQSFNRRSRRLIEKGRRKMLKAFKKKPKASEADLRSEYGKACVKAGELQYQIYILQAALEETNREIKELNQQYNSVKESADAQPVAPPSQP